MVAAVAGLASACGGDGVDDLPPRTPEPAAKYELFELRVVQAVPALPLVPGAELTYELTYRGDEIGSQKVTAVFTDLATGAVVVEKISDWSATRGATFQRMDTWRVVLDDRFRKVGTVQVELEAEVKATKPGSEPWVVKAQPMTLGLNPVISSVKVLPSAGPHPYGTPLQLQVDGQGLWGNVVVRGIDERGLPLEGVRVEVPRGLASASNTVAFTPRSLSLEKVGTHQVILEASFGEVTARSEPFWLTVIYTLDSVAMTVRRPEGVVASAGPTRLTEIKDLLFTVKGTNLAGREVTFNGDETIVAPADEFELTHVPAFDAFPEGRAAKEFHFDFVSGPFKRSLAKEIHRWGMTGCGWRSSDGGSVGSPVDPGVQVVMYADIWGFPDTKSTLGFLKDRQATFTLWERDSGRDVEGRPEFEDNDDKVDSWGSDIIAGGTSKGWVTEHAEEPGIPIIGGDALGTNAEMYFEVTLEDQMCTSEQLSVRQHAQN